MINKIPIDILLMICEKMDFVDIMSLKKTNSELFYSTLNISEYIITKELLKMKYPITKHDIYIQINEVLKNTYYKAKDDIYKNQIYKNIILPNSLIKYYIYNNVNNYNISINKSINTIFHKLLKYYIIHGDISYYNDKYIIFIFYILLNISVFQNIKNVKYNVKFLDSFYKQNCKNKKKNECYKIMHDYFSFLLLNHTLLQFDIQYIISKYVTSMHYLKKLFCIKQLNLKNTKLISCCIDLDYINLKEIINYKYNIPKDDLISYNYIEFKSFIQKNCDNYFDLMEEYELSLINNHIIYRNPFNRNHMRLNSKVSYKLLYKLKYESIKTKSNIKIYQNIEKYIIKKQKELYNYYFN